MWTILQQLFNDSTLSPHGLCLLWRPDLVWLQVGSDAVIALAYFSIPFALAVFAANRPDVKYGWVFWSFATFILACGMTHVMSIWTLWVPDYGWEGLVKAVTAVASISTAIALWPLLPKALAYPTPAQFSRVLSHEQQTRAKREELETVLRATPFLLTRCGRDLRYHFISESYGQMLGLNPEDVVGKAIVDVVGEEAFKTMLPHIEQVLQGNRAEYESEINFRSAGVRALHVVYTPDRNDNGEVIGWIASIRDVTERQEARKREKALLMEVQHRSNNLLAVVQSIAQQTFANDQSLDNAKKAFESRLQALAKTNRKLTNSNWRGLGLREVIRLEMEPYGDRMSAQGADVLLAPKQAEYVSLALHELATNAAKYGALSNAEGKVVLSWMITEQAKTGKLHLKWQESGGPAVVVPGRQGFGTALIKATFPDARLNYSVEGFSCEFQVALSDDAESEDTLTADSPSQNHAAGAIRDMAPEASQAPSA
jgi:PAS domain S-box-containing protein